MKSVLIITVAVGVVGSALAVFSLTRPPASPGAASYRDVGWPEFAAAFRAGELSDGATAHLALNGDYVLLTARHQPASGAAEHAPGAPVGLPAPDPAPASPSLWSATGYMTEAELLEFRQAGFKSLVGEAATRHQAHVDAAGLPLHRRWAAALGRIAPASVISLVLLLGFAAFVLVRFGGRTSRFSFLGRPAPVQASHHRFADVAGCDEAKQEVSEVVEYLRDPTKFSAVGGRVPKGVLLVGPPGTGKTLLARAVAGEAKVPFFSLSGSDFVEMYVGVGARRVRQLFAAARKTAPAIIFIDELDAVGSKRSMGSERNSEECQTLNAILTEMDGFAASEGVIVFAATNRPDALDPALRRPGRFDRTVAIDLPDVRGRVSILQVHLAKVKLQAAVQVDAIAARTAGFSGAELANLVNEAALHAVRNHHGSVEPSDFDEAREKLLWGRERRKVMTDDDRRTIACHEAGHALMRLLDGEADVRLEKVTIIPRGQSLGSTHFSPERELYNQSQEQLEARIRCLMAGRVAEEIITGRITSGASADIHQATQVARSMVLTLGMSGLGFVAIGNADGENGIVSPAIVAQAEEKILELLHRLYRETDRHLRAEESSLRALTDALETRETLSGTEARELFRTGSKMPRCRSDRQIADELAALSRGDSHPVALDIHP